MTTGRSLRSLIASDGTLRLSLVERDIPEPTGSQVVVAVEASPINPSDLGVLLGAVDPAGLRRDGAEIVGEVPAAALAVYRDRLDKPLPVGNEGAGIVVAAGPDAAHLVGRRVALFGGLMWADFRVADAAAVVELPDDVSTPAGAALFVNPLTALSMVETMRAEGHTALVHTAAASNLGQMLVRICAADGIGLVNIVRRADHVRLLRDLGAEHVVDSSLPDFSGRLTEAIRATGATLAFDAIGGGTLAGDILTAMEHAQPPLQSWTPYGTTVPKQVYIYGALDFSPTVIDRRFGLTWGVGGFLLTNALGRLGGEAIARMRARVIAEATTTFASGYAQTIGLADVLDLETLVAASKRGTGSKFLIDPSRDRT
ncbi:zinc-binding dehydrogenase [Paraconexibacter antarcticus]|uniref:Zinc-binding dehydrogenase n=1 Tax=Paraconexibacter antarcticus TaxID=2949664 RepID=A0ABY5E0I2_9ACTN|nr:zinc-binding dehydrogenase [Paraconexibacter antarcticus]UTI66662.1 zinc-binding dehydrogenase [Paraconexibacter antarcticus]